MIESSQKEEEDTVGKGEIAHDEQFLLFPHCFQKTLTGEGKLVWKRVKVSCKLFSRLRVNPESFM